MEDIELEAPSLGQSGIVSTPEPEVEGGLRLSLPRPGPELAKDRTPPPRCVTFEFGHLSGLIFVSPVSS